MGLTTGGVADHCPGQGSGQNMCQLICAIVHLPGPISDVISAARGVTPLVRDVTSVVSDVTSLVRDVTSVALNVLSIVATEVHVVILVVEEC